MITAEELANAIVRDVAELPDRNSPEGWPEAMIVTADELRLIVQSRAAGVRGAGDAETIAAEMEAWADNQNWPRHQHDRVDIRNLAKRVRRLATPQPPNTIRVDVEQIGSCELDVRDGVAYMPDVTVQDIVSKSCLKPQPPKDADCPSNESPGDSLSLRGAAGRSVSRPAKGAGDNPSPDSPIMKWAESAIADRNGAKDAGAVPLPKMVGMISDRPICFQDEVARYGNAREAAGRADAVQAVSDEMIETALNARLGLDHTLRQLIRGDTMPVGYSKVEVVRALLAELRTLPQHPPAEPAARAQDGVPPAKKWVDENGVEVTAEWMAGWDACRVEYPRAHPSPAHAGAGDAEALADFTEWLAREMPEGTVISDPRWWAPRIARRLAGGDHDA